jgi:hypothetical protein
LNERRWRVTRSLGEKAGGGGWLETCANRR